MKNWALNCVRHCTKLDDIRLCGLLQRRFFLPFSKESPFRNNHPIRVISGFGNRNQYQTFTVICKRILLRLFLELLCFQNIDIPCTPIIARFLHEYAFHLIIVFSSFSIAWDELYLKKDIVWICNTCYLAACYLP